MGDVPGEVWDISDEDFGLENIDRLAANDDETSEEDSDEMVKHDT